jgi:hypothetical protein
MAGKRIGPLPEELAEARRGFELWRASTGHRRPRIPTDFWTKAIELAQAYGTYKTAVALRLNYMGLKKRVAAASSENPPQEESSAAFVEFVSDAHATYPECIVELEGARGTKMRIHLKGAAPDLVALSRMFWREEI